eukprot:TRINITY_DN3306_c0_g1_i2.p1 TRINITY_DN3306_c0_g1~~TRINITY_DN3306_c0_g1_i2.p1  ORF type:complete len:355 (+),score=107.93 TRINITY_DN3306_c0_g1_i2:70-1065(+)
MCIRDRSKSGELPGKDRTKGGQRVNPHIYESRRAVSETSKRTPYRDERDPFARRPQDGMSHLSPAPPRGMEVEDQLFTQRMRRAQTPQPMTSQGYPFQRRFDMAMAPRMDPFMDNVEMPGLRPFAQDFLGAVSPRAPRPVFNPWAMDVETFEDPQGPVEVSQMFQEEILREESPQPFYNPSFIERRQPPAGNQSFFGRTPVEFAPNPMRDIWSEMRRSITPGRRQAMTPSYQPLNIPNLPMNNLRQPAQGNPFASAGAIAGLGRGTVAPGRSTAGFGRSTAGTSNQWGGGYQQNARQGAQTPRQPSFERQYRQNYPGGGATAGYSNFGAFR